MAQLNRASLLRMRADELRTAAEMVAVSEALDEWDLREVLLDVAAEMKRRMDDLKKPTTLPGIITQGDVIEVIGGFDFYEVFRFEKRRFLRLFEALDIPQRVTRPVLGKLLKNSQFETRGKILATPALLRYAGSPLGVHGTMSGFLFASNSNGALTVAHVQYCTIFSNWNIDL